MALLSLWNFLLTPWPSSDSKVAVSGSRYLRRVCVCVCVCVGGGGSEGGEV